MVQHAVRRMAVDTNATAEGDLFLECVQDSLQPLSRFCQRLTRDRWEGEELFQDALLRAFVAFRLHGASMTKSYLFKIAQNAYIDKCRKRRISTVPLSEVELPANPGIDPLELRDAVTHLVRCLPPRQRLVYLLREVFQIPAAEIAKQTGMTEGAVKAALHRARRALKSAHEPHVDTAGRTSDGTTENTGDRPTEDNTIASYLAAIRESNPDVFLGLLARVQMQSDITVHQLARIQPIAVSPRVNSSSELGITTARLAA